MKYKADQDDSAGIRTESGQQTDRKLCLKRLSARWTMWCVGGGQRDGPQRLFVVDVRIGI